MDKKMDDRRFVYRPSSLSVGFAPQGETDRQKNQFIDATQPRCYNAPAMSIVTGKHIILGISGGIAAYKVAELARQLTLDGAIVDVIMTEAARRFVGEATFQALTGRPVLTDL